MTTIEIISAQNAEIQNTLAKMAQLAKPVPPETVAEIGRNLIEKLYQTEAGGEGLLSSLVMSSGDAPIPPHDDVEDSVDESDDFQPITRAALDAYIASRAAPNWSRWLRQLR